MRMPQRPDVRPANRRITSPSADDDRRLVDPQAVGWSLCEAASQGAIDVARARLADGADIDALGPDGRTPLMIAASCQQAAMAQWLLANGASLDRRDAFGLSALDIARAHGAADVIAVLQRAHPSV